MGQVLAVADTRVASRLSEIHEPVLDDDLDPHPGMGEQEAVDQGRQDVDRHGARHA